MPFALVLSSGICSGILKNMARIIPFESGCKVDDNLITARPLEFRRGDWRRGQIIQCLRQEADKYQAHRREALSAGHRHLRFVPQHFSLAGGHEHTAMGLYRWREKERQAREVYRLAGLMECVVNSSCPLLRTDLLRSLYRAIADLREQLKVTWLGGSSQFLLPLHPYLYERERFFDRICKAHTLKDLYLIVDEETRVQFDLLAAQYVFYLPRLMSG